MENSSPLRNVSAEQAEVSLRDSNARLALKP
ncbi:hypothetical protein B0O95_11226 [Mycetohabitans endofungorum]|uniref:Uncharacterized protein n=1 Tax=Mycetohabitans endofungorum TaxID=417203 RepID=A0A2P5K801_9BURK|nr:hypothetical protein B0O95_11226 [Mycetohabitans endofungorum]